MRVAIFSDKFKGTITSKEVGYILSQSLRSVSKEIDVRMIPIADGGDGSLEILSDLLDLDLIKTSTVDALGREVTSEYGIKGREAFIEVANSTGLAMLAAEERNPLHTSTFGTGLVVLEALERGANRIHLLLGGTSTCDMGLGLARALGWSFRDEHGEILDGNGSDLPLVRSMKGPTNHERSFEIICWCDVDNPLYGSQGSAHVYGPQKGADDEAVKILDEGLRHMAGLIREDLKRSVCFEGAGAAGGIPAGMVALFDAKVRSGIETFFELTNFDEVINEVDVVITGEGKLDAHSFSGKVVGAVVQKSKEGGKKVVVVCGISELKSHTWRDHGLDHVYALRDFSNSQEQAMREGKSLLFDVGQMIAKSLI